MDTKCMSWGTQQLPLGSADCSVAMLYQQYQQSVHQVQQQSTVHTTCYRPRRSYSPHPQ